MKIFLSHIIIALFFLVPMSASGEILVVQSLPIKPYNEALDGFRSVCKSGFNRIVGPDLRETEVIGKVRRYRPELILAIGMDALLKVKTINDVPIVYVMVLNPHTLVRDAANITGVSMNISPEKQFSLIREVLPNIRKIAVFFDPGKSGYFVGRAYNAASLMGLDLLTKKVQSPREAVTAIDGLKGKADALWLLPDTTVVTPETIDFILLSSIENSIPVITFSDKYAEKGALLSMEVNPADAGKQAGEMASRLLGGANIRSIEDEDARNCIMTVNLLVAKKLRIHIKSDLINHARIIR
jgi:putative tryptophan/tyrosine transport system substrate-binding protein